MFLAPKLVYAVGISKFGRALINMLNDCGTPNITAILIDTDKLWEALLDC